MEAKGRIGFVTCHKRWRLICRQSLCAVMDGKRNHIVNLLAAIKHPGGGQQRPPAAQHESAHFRERRSVLTAGGRV